MVSERAKDQSAMKRDDNVLDDLDDPDFGEKSKRRATGIEDPVYRRPVLDCKAGENSIKQWELSQVELNGLKSEQKDLIDYYGDVKLIRILILTRLDVYPTWIYHYVCRCVSMRAGCCSYSKHSRHKVI